MYAHHRYLQPATLLVRHHTTATSIYNIIHSSIIHNNNKWRIQHCQIRTRILAHNLNYHVLRHHFTSLSDSDPTKFSGAPFRETSEHIGTEPLNNQDKNDIGVYSSVVDDVYNSQLACVEVSDKGGVNDIELTRQQIAAEFNLHMRDVRFLDSSLRNLPSILARDQVILVNLEMFKAIISRKKTLIFDHWYPQIQAMLPELSDALQPYNTHNNKHRTGMYSGYQRMTLADKSHNLPYELIVLEYILLCVTQQAEERFDSLTKQLRPLLDDMVSGRQMHEGATLMELLQSKNKLTEFLVLLKEHGKALEDVLKNDDDLNAMYLTRSYRAHKHAIQPHRRELEQHDECEEILETYFRKILELRNEVDKFITSIDLTENHIQIRLDVTRNSVMKIELMMAIATLGVAIGALGASIFGMNLNNGLDVSTNGHTSTYYFWFVGGLFAALSYATWKVGIHFCRTRNIDLFSKDKSPSLKLRLDSRQNRKMRYNQQRYLDNQQRHSMNQQQSCG